MSFRICDLRLCKNIRDVVKNVLETSFRRSINVDIVDTRSHWLYCVYMYLKICFVFIRRFECDCSLNIIIIYSILLKTWLIVIFIIRNFLSTSSKKKQQSIQVFDIYFNNFENQLISYTKTQRITYFFIIFKSKLKSILINYQNLLITKKKTVDLDFSFEKQYKKHSSTQRRRQVITQTISRNCRVKKTNITKIIKVFFFKNNLKKKSEKHRRKKNRKTTIISILFVTFRLIVE